MLVQKQESFNFYSHLSGGIVSLFAGFFLVSRTSSRAELITALIYAFSLSFLFFASAFYHAFKKQENEISFWRKMDRLAIFFMIAGSYTPISYFYLEGYWSWGMIVVQWSFLVFGLISQIFFPNASRKLYAGIYLAMGWTALFSIKQIMNNMPEKQLFFLFTGAFFFTLGGLIYAVKKPNFSPENFGFHGLFHLMVLAGGGLHYAMILDLYS